MPGGRLPLIGHLLPLGRDILGCLDRWARELGDLYRVDAPGRRMWVVARPEEIERILVHGQYFMKAADVDHARPVLGNGLVTSEGELWMKQRRMMQPAFHKERVAAYGQRMVAVAEQTISTWKAASTRDLHRDAGVITLQIATDTLFGDDEVSAEDVGKAVRSCLRRFDGVVALLPSWLPLPAMSRFREGVEQLEAIVYDVIRRRRGEPTERHDLLSILLDAQDEDGTTMTDRQLRDEVLTLLISGHETLANALTWSWHLLSQSPEAEQKLFDEVDGLSGPPTVADLPRLTFTAAVLNESMRVYPPGWIFGRRVVREWDLAGFRVPPDDELMLCPWSVHRDARWFPEPLRFRPERWLDGSTESLPKYAYFPFGGGQRLCIGRPFALMEGTLVLATIARRWRLRALDGHVVVPHPSFTLRPRGGLPMQLDRR
jgi:cytochrome P450